MRKLPVVLSIVFLGAASLMLVRSAFAEGAGTSTEAGQATASEANGEGASAQSGMDTAKPTSGKAVKAKKKRKTKPSSSSDSGAAATH